MRGDRWYSWVHLVKRLMEVKSIYADYMNDHTKFLKKYPWKLKVPLKIRIFMWFLYKKVLLTKDNLAKRNWIGCKKMCFL
jgi:hypothetical protein